jgi:hypothetical protein
VVPGNASDAVMMLMITGDADDADDALMMLLVWYYINVIMK